MWMIPVQLRKGAWLYLLHVALLTIALAPVGLFFNLAVLALGYPRQVLGVLTTLSVLCGAAAALPLLWLVSQAGPRRGLQLAVLVQATSTALLAWAPGLVGLAAATVAGTLAGVLVAISATPLMMQHSEAHDRDVLFSINSAILIGVSGLGSLLAGRLPELLAAGLHLAPQSAGAYRAVFAVATIGVLGALFPLAGMVDPIAAAAPHSPVPARAAAVSRTLTGTLWRQAPSLTAFLAAPAVISFGAALLIPYLNLYFRERFQVDDAGQGIIFALLGGATALASLLAPLLARRLGRMPAVACTQALSIPFLLALGFVPLLAPAVAAGLLRAALMNMANPLYEAFVMEQTSERLRPAVNGLLNGAHTAGFAVAPLLSTWVQAQAGFAPLFVATAGCYAVAAMVTWWLFVRQGARTITLV